MNKRTWLILIPLFALLFNSYGRDHHSVSLPVHLPGSRFTTVKNLHPFSTDLKKEEKKVNKNTIRIKAWDGSFAIDISTQWAPVEKPCYCSKPVYSTYRNHGYHIAPSCNDLRGPPSFVI